ncbi:hypothetical protein PPL_09429 [Heterostelium album PN500]|uniref:Uncharacterized protein n=1 Tax=Heterostelium pallidum (strain ATCC 26659 / Pp 5 / PN500) TaxID=670386 RepID=D3BPG1_HETP5|nr:hypothetical protein PPL_09429 [Heterostelium album PN500]EFA76679.1 hypothetical protein PPL_09429 [Heterostelium album PN500]|eukprot:XP_020428811.1 hypothetical protein PPL_09429 [Heterostelium album PN500]
MESVFQTIKHINRDFEVNPSLIDLANCIAGILGAIATILIEEYSDAHRLILNYIHAGMPESERDSLTTIHNKVCKYLDWSKDYYRFFDKENSWRVFCSRDDLEKYHSFELEKHKNDDGSIAPSSAEEEELDHYFLVLDKAIQQFYCSMTMRERSPLTVEELSTKGTSPVYSKKEYNYNTKSGNSNILISGSFKMAFAVAFIYMATHIFPKISHHVQVEL